ncbi:hydantoinase B/oxoprolinase family protein [Desulfofustis glycolicus]|uniref:5-oxoprolinase (ATP-hydrolysing) n=1 Tax=Desulfofustis glycolicus DSM 9705 TaxID=1121409 RepID=A0A1M5SH00_9BACT|nr:hydantoinase B/oxoprolinase family protein [Desulfofustis glycolicus]MCB2215815.1 hydantoinase B/oxoprolinase family protein [Desulfobulbaceae bacterium]SHH37725.1 5-oxoprolinase (ATP-hydrolysing) [Desulfofustis glycolicus DSM 9705]
METKNSTAWRIWIDRGGTFTDVVARQPDGTIVTHKLLSENPEQYDDAAVQGIRDLLGIGKREPIPTEHIEHVKMGTTVATNALLERTGDRTLLVITRGFGDALRIGYQNRPRLFDRHIVLPELLYEEVAEVSERLGAGGEVICEFDEDELTRSLRASYERGIRAVAIVFMHAYRYPQHEQRAAALARSIGFTQVSTSHEASPLMKLVPRGDTTVVDAYLSPILRRYVDQVAGDLGGTGESGPRLMFMQSNGGLTDARMFQGRDAILSGPAGGVVGMVKTAEMSGYRQLIGFDMGGTSTDVAHYDGAYERSFETMVAGVRMRAPMMHIHTVAAGGGSILHFDGARYRVGPDSAGANPGPVCYRRGGPLTVTDCNVMLGKVQPDFFPHVFGADADRPLDREAVVARFAEMAAKIARATDLPVQPPELVADGFLRIAVENMANAIKKISVQRGHDITDYTMNCFGGAGGQHACLVADALGMTRIFLHPFAGVLSAYGMGLADITAMREVQIEHVLDEPVMAIIESKSRPLEEEARQELVSQGVAAEEIVVLRRVHIRYDGTDTSLIVEAGECETMREAFEQAHRQRFGFIARERRLMVEAVSIEAVGAGEMQDDEMIDEGPDDQPFEPIARADVFMAGQWQTTPLFDRAVLEPGQAVEGPAIIIEPTGTVVVEPGWRAALNNRRHLILTRYLQRPRAEAVGTHVDPVMLEVFNNLFMSIAEQMGATLANTSYSVNIKERLDFSCAVFNEHGDLVANAPHVPVHLGSMSDSVKTIIRENEATMRPGSVYMLNAPYNGGTHLPDVTVVTPVFDEAGRDILFYVGSRGHHADIGGRTPGSSPPDSRHIDEEGVLIDNFLLVEDGRLREEETRRLLASGPYPCRNINQNMADLTAQIAANETGVNELRKMVAQFGLDVVHAYMKHVQDNAEESVRRVLDVLKDGRFVNHLDGGQQIAVEIRVDRERREAVIDFTGTSPQHPGNYNAPTAVCRAAVLYVFRTLVNDEIPLNEGCLKPLRIVVPPETMISPRYPAAVISGNTEVSQAITDTLYGALGILAASQGTMNNFVYGNETYQNYETICGGTGAGPDHPGTSAVHSHMTNTRMTDPEVVEWRFPVRLESFAIRRGSGGAGRYSGGDGVIREMRFLEPMTATILSSHRETAPYGLAGGEDGARGRNYVVRKDGSRVELRGNDEIDMQPGDLFVIETPGGGGFGKP